MKSQHLLIVSVPAGLNILDTPRSQTEGARVRRAVAIGTPLYARLIITPKGVPYANLQPVDPQKPEWVRMGEAGFASFDGRSWSLNEQIKHYVDMQETPQESDDIADAIRYLADAIKGLQLK